MPSYCAPWPYMHFTAICFCQAGSQVHNLKLYHQCYATILFIEKHVFPPKPTLGLTDLTEADRVIRVPPCCFSPSVAVDQLAKNWVWHCDCLERKTSLHRVDWSDVVIASLMESPPWNLLPIRRLGVVELEAHTSVMPKSLKPITYLDCWRHVASGHRLAREPNNESPAN